MIAMFKHLDNDFQLHTVHQEHNRLNPRMNFLISFNSTRYIRNVRKAQVGRLINITFNSTRYIRNLSPWQTTPCLFLNDFQLHTVHQELSDGSSKITQASSLSTPHGTLGTSFSNSPTRSHVLFQLHTVHQEPQTTTLTKIRHINNFVKGVPLSNEVNFPKSEIMQS